MSPGAWWHHVISCGKTGADCILGCSALTFTVPGCSTTRCCPFCDCLHHSLLTVGPCRPRCLWRCRCAWSTSENASSAFFSILVSWEQRWLGKPVELQLEPVNCWAALYRQLADCINSSALGIFWSLNAQVGCLNIILTWVLFFPLMECYTLLQLLCLGFDCALVYSGCLLVFVWNKI